MGDINLLDCLIYLDDIIIFSDTFEAHLDRLEAVFQRLHTYNLKLKASKCEFFKKEVTYLGPRKMACPQERERCPKISWFHWVL